MNFALAEWLLNSDPALRWHVERDLLNYPESIWRETRARVPHEGFAARLLALQDSDGQWDGGSYFPKGFDFSTIDTLGQPWTATTWSLNSLREWGLDAAALLDTADRLERNSHWDYDDLPYWDGEVDCCINAYTLANGTWLGRDMTHLARWFVEHQMEEGGWNCDWVEGSTRSSFHSTLNSLLGILEYEIRVGGNSELTKARHRAEEYLLQRHLLHRNSSGDHVSNWVSNFSYPERWKYSALRAAEYFRRASLHDQKMPDSRIGKAMDLIRESGEADGRYLQGRTYPGKVWFEVDVPEGQASKWITLFAHRTLKWWESIEKV